MMEEMLTHDKILGYLILTDSFSTDRKLRELLYECLALLHDVIPMFETCQKRAMKSLTD